MTMMTMMFARLDLVIWQPHVIHQFPGLIWPFLPSFLSLLVEGGVGISAFPFCFLRLWFWNSDRRSSP